MSRLIATMLGMMAASAENRAETLRQRTAQKHDPERVKVAEAKRARKAAKRAGKTDTP